MARVEIPLALLMFNIGVELGQLAFVALIVLLHRALRVLEFRWPRWAELPAVELGISLSAVVLGALILGAIRLPLAAALLVVGFFAVFHGHAHGTEMSPGQSAILYSIGFVIATGLLHALGIGGGLIHHWNVGRIALRGAGAVVLAGGLFFLWSALA